MTNSPIDVFRYNLKFYRTKLGLTQEQLSELTGISCDYLSEIERGKRTPSFKRMIMISNALNIDVYLLFKPQDL